MNIQKIHHIAIICSSNIYHQSKKFYTEVLGFETLQEIFRSERNSYKLDLTLNGMYQIELFSFPEPPKRVTQPEAEGLRHLAFATSNILEDIKELQSKGIEVQEPRIDEYTGKLFTFLFAPEGTPIELYEV